MILRASLKGDPYKEACKIFQNRPFEACLTCLLLKSLRQIVFSAKDHENWTAKRLLLDEGFEGGSFCHLAL